MGDVKGGELTKKAQVPRRPSWDVLMSVLAIVSVVIGLYELGKPPAQETGMTSLDWLDLAVVGIFITDFVWDARQERKRTGTGFRRYILSHWWEIPSLLPITGGMIAGMEAFPLLRGLRLLRLVRLVRVMRVVGVLLRFRRLTHYLSAIAERAGLVAFASAAILIVLFGGLAIEVAERRNEHLQLFEDCLWWSLNMFTNVAYVEATLQTGGGRVIAGILQIMGLIFNTALFGSVINAVLKVKPPAA